MVTKGKQALLGPRRGGQLVHRLSPFTRRPALRRPALSLALPHAPSLSLLLHPASTIVLLPGLLSPLAFIPPCFPDPDPTHPSPGVSLPPGFPAKELALVRVWLWSASESMDSVALAGAGSRSLGIPPRRFHLWPSHGCWACPGGTGCSWEASRS